MNRCPESTRIQDYLDGEFVPAERLEFEAHVAGCEACAFELAAYRRVFDRLATLETWEPSAGLADRVLAEVMPRHPSRWLRPLAWSVGVTAAASVAAIGSAVFMPGPRAWMNGLVAEAAGSVVSSFVFVLKSFNAGALRAIESLGASGAVVGRVLSVLHALFESASQPAVAFTLWAALLAGVALLWWMRPHEDRSVQEDHHVGMLGF
jgi:anti-sigma factor RsiW